MTTSSPSIWTISPPGGASVSIHLWVVTDTPLLCFSEVAVLVLGYKERSDKPEGNLLVLHPTKTWENLGIGRQRSDHHGLAGEMQYATISFPLGSAAARHLMLTVPQLLQAVNGKNPLSADRRTALVHAIAPSLSLEAAVTKGNWLQCFKDVRTVLTHSPSLPHHSPSLPLTHSPR